MKDEDSKRRIQKHILPHTIDNINEILSLDKTVKDVFKGGEQIVVLRQ